MNEPHEANNPQEDLVIRPATADDVPAIVALLADDVLGAGRETPADPAPYLAAFDRVTADPAHSLVVMTRAGRVVGTLQLTLLPGLSSRGATRALIEAVRVDSAERGAGLGTRLLRWAEDSARDLGAGVVQLTSHGSRKDAHRFYERLGYTASHVGFKREL